MQQIYNVICVSSAVDPTAVCCGSCGSLFDCLAAKRKICWKIGRKSRQKRRTTETANGNGNGTSKMKMKTVSHITQEIATQPNATQLLSSRLDSTQLNSTQVKSSGQGSDRRTTGLTLGSGGLFASREVLKKAPRSVRDFGKT